MAQLEGYGNEFKLKYLYLDKLFGDRLDRPPKGKKSKKVSDVNIFINFESLYNLVRRKDNEKVIANADKKELKLIYRTAISEFINVAAHYREYFKRHKVRTNIFYYFNELEEEYVDYNNSAFIPGYRNHFIESTTALNRMTLNSLIADSVPFMRIIAEYIDSLYMVGTKRVEASLIPFIILMSGKYPANINMIITKDEYDYQYVNYNFLMITRYQGDPIVLTKKNMMSFYRHKRKLFDTDKKPVREINSLLLPFIQCFEGDKKRSIPGIKGYGFKTVYRELEGLYEAGYIFDEEPDTMSIGNLCDVLSMYGAEVFQNQYLKDDLLNTYKAYDFEYQYSVVSSGQKEHIFDQLKNRSDPAGLMELNERYFEYSPLMVLELNNYNSRTELGKYLEKGEDDEDVDE